MRTLQEIQRAEKCRVGKAMLIQRRELESELAQASETSVDWAILYDDPSHPTEMFTEEAAARATFDMRLVEWSCHLFRRVSERPKLSNGGN